MNRAEYFYLLPYLFSLVLSVAIFVYTWRHRYIRGARVYSWFVGGQVLAILGFIFELLSPNLQSKLLWDRFQWLADSFLIILPFLIFSVQFSEHKLRYPVLIWGYVTVLLFVFTLILLTDDLHHLLYPNPHLSTDSPFPELEYDFTFVVYAYALLYVYGSNFYGIGLLLRRAMQPYNPYRRQYWTIVIGFSIPLLLSFLSLADIRIAPQRDIAPLALAIGNTVVAWGLFRYRLFDIAPIARERIVENMSDPVIVLDPQNRVVDVNHAAITLIGKQSSEVIGQSSANAFARWPVVVELLANPYEQRREVSVRSKGEILYFDVSISGIRSKSNALLGRIVVARDITRHKNLEMNYRALSEELEQRVHDRTEELRASSERYRAVVENQTEFIVRWKPDGTRTFVNDAYCRYFGITPAQALTESFFHLIFEEDRGAVEEKFSRLIAGTVDVETSSYRVICPDGSLGWQEWTDQVLRDQSGRVIEFQSVGRDITERKQAEEIILRQLAFDALMTRTLTEFATCSYSEVDASINHALRELAEFYCADFADILFYAEEKKSWESTHQWIVPHLRASVRPTQSIGAGTLTWTEGKLLKGEAIRINTLDDYPAEAVSERQFAETEGMQSLLSVLIKGRERSIFGVIDIASYDRQLAWTESDVTHLKIVGDAIANILERKRAEEDLARAYDTTLEGWAKALELRDKETEGHSRRVTETTVAIARTMEIPEEELLQIKRGAVLHDIGKMGIPDQILHKEGPLTQEERQIILRHPETAYELLKQTPFLEKALEIPYCHHEKWDGSGYPRGLKEGAIPISARIFAVADVWDALTSDRPYRKAWPKEKVRQYIRDEAGKHFDPGVVKVFLEMVDQGKI